MFQPLAAWLKRWRERAELRAMDINQRNDMARDLGVCVAELDYLLRRAHDPQHLPRMFKALDIDEAAQARVHPALVRDMQRTCSVCPVTDMCSFALRQGVANLTYPDFCPNADALTSLAEKGWPRKQPPLQHSIGV